MEPVTVKSEKTEESAFLPPKFDVTIWGNDMSHPPFWKRLRSDEDYRGRFLNTLCVWTALFMFGFTYSQQGPALPDLRQISNVDLDTASWLLTAFSFGYILGASLAGFIEKRFNPILLLFISLCVTATSTIITPWCKIYGLMLTARVCYGISCGVIDPVGHAFLFSIWKLDVHIYIQIMYFLFSTGGLISPLITTPFLSKEFNQTERFPSNTTSNSATHSYHDDFNQSEYFSERHMSFNKTPFVKYSPCKNCSSLAYTETNVHYSFLISGIICIGSSLPFLLIYYRSKHNAMNDKSGATKKSVRQRTSKLKFAVAMVILTLMFGLITGWIGSFAGFLMTFALRHLKWTKPKGSLATTMFWLANAVGNLACAFLVQYFRTGTLFFCFILIAVTALSGLAVSSIFLADAPVWICILLTGFAMSLMWPAAFTWTEERVTSVTGYIASLFLVAGSAGGMLNPLAIGYTMDNITNIGYVYWILGEGVLLLTLFMAVSVLYWNTGSNAARKPDSEGTELEARYDIHHRITNQLN